MERSKAEALFSDRTRPDVLSETKEPSLLPNTKSKYKVVYDNFVRWKNKNKMRSFTEDVFLAYFRELAIKYKPTTLWSMCSMLKSTVLTTNGVDIKTYANLNNYLRECSNGYEPGTKIKILSPTDIETFLSEAPDRQYLATKVGSTANYSQ